MAATFTIQTPWRLADLLITAWDGRPELPRLSVSGDRHVGENQEIMKSQRALVTGGAGFLGSHLCDALLGDGYSVVAVG